MNEQEVNEVMELERKLYRLYQSGNVDEMIDHLMENARVCPPGSESIVGRENQRVLFKELAKMEGFELFWEPLEACVSASSDMAYVYGSVRWKMPGSAEEVGKYISVWMKENGEWRNAVEIRNSNG